MLGKGLESLIPQKGSGSNSNNAGGDDHHAEQTAAAQISSPQDSSQPQPLLPQQPEPILINPPVLESQQVQQTHEPERTHEPEKSREPEKTPAKTIFDIATPQQAVSGSIFQIEVDKIEPNPDQPRRHFDETALHDLAHSIREFGFLQPIVVTKIGKETASGVDVEYQVIAGERRLLVAKLLGLRLVPAIVRNVSLEREKLELAVIENLQRENLNPIETARAFQRLQEEFRMTQREIAAKLGKSREVVANTVRLLDLPEYIQVAVQEGNLSESNARLLLSVGDPAAQKRLFEDVVANRLTTRDVKERVREFVRPRATHLFGGRGGGAGGGTSPEWQEAQETLSAKLGAPVEIHKGAGPGKITIVFYSQEELESILQKLKSGEGEE